MAQHDPAWTAAYEAWATARRAEMAYDAEVWRPNSDADIFDKEVEDEMERLLEHRCSLEPAILDVPASTAAQLATKVLITFDNGREAFGYLPDILTDCRRFADDSLTRGPLSDGVDVERIGDAGHRDWLAERNAMFEAAEGAGTISEADGSRMNQLEAHIMDTPARSGGDVIAKLALIAQIVAEGFEPPPEQALATIAEARVHLGVGTTFGLLPAAEAADAD